MACLRDLESLRHQRVHQLFRTIHKGQEHVELASLISCAPMFRQSRVALQLKLSSQMALMTLLHQIQTRGVWLYTVLASSAVCVSLSAAPEGGLTK